MNPALYALPGVLFGAGAALIAWRMWGRDRVVSVLAWICAVLLLSACIAALTSAVWQRR